MENDWKKRLGVVFSTNPDFGYDGEPEDKKVTLPPGQQKLVVMRDRKRRKGKTVTLVTGFCGSEEDITALGKMLKTKCGVGGTVKDGEILIQGDFGARIMEILTAEGYRARRSGGGV